MKSGNLINIAGPRAGILACLMAACVVSPAAHAIIGEPETIVYGRIVNRINPNAEQLVIEGELLWSIQKPDGSVIQLTGEVADLSGGNYSYTLRIPHEAGVLGESPSAQIVALGTSTSTAYHRDIVVNGTPAEILPPATSGFDLDQLLRAAAVRIDLEINEEGLDSDGDGIADWWEDEHGLDKQDPSDALVDSNGNGLNNLAEFLAGNDPNLDPTHPLLLTREIIAYAESDSLVPLEVADSDTGAEQLVFTVYTLPESGTLVMRNAGQLPEPTDHLLVVGETFTLADVRDGRLVYSHSSGSSPATFEVGVRDEDPTHEESRGEVSVLLFESFPDSLAMTSSEKVRFESHRLSRDSGHLVADFGAADGEHILAAPSAGLSEGDYQSHVEDYGSELPHILLGGPADDVLTGGAANDFILGDLGADLLTGGRGADSFLYIQSSPDIDVILDFNPGEGDVIDISAVLDGSSTLLTDYVRIRRSGTDALLEVSAGGTGAGFTDLIVRLQDSPLQPSDLAGLYYNGNLEAGEVGLPPRLSIVAGEAASENGPKDGSFVIIREGNLDEDLSASLQFSGNASNGADYQFIASSLVLPAGAGSIEVPIRPYVDATVEFDETVFVSLISSSGYLLSTSSSAQITIEDLKPQISLELLEPLASVENGSPGSILMRRGGLTSPEVFVQFDLAGTAVNGDDYNYVTPHLVLNPGQTTKLIQFSPKPAVSFDGAEAKTIRMTLTPDVAYALPVPMASVMIVPRKLTYDAWLAEAGMSEETEEGMPLVMRYAFALDPLLASDPAAFGRMPRPNLEGGHLTLSFRRKPGISDLRYQVEYSTDLTHWSSGPDVVEDITAEAAPDDPGAAVYRATQPMSEADRGAMRVRLLLPGESSN